MRAGVRLRPHAGRVGARGRGPPRRRRDRRGRDDPAQHGHGARHRGQPRPRAARASRRASAPSARCRGRQGLASPADVDDANARARRDDALLARVDRARARSPTTAGARPSSARPWRSRASPTCRPGATIAALTTSLPETPGGERNWDYRYTWIRDSTFTLQALHWLNLDWEADEFMQFIADLEPNEDGGLQIMYGIDGRRDLTESTRDDLSGYAGARPVRIGNGAFDQRQNDVYGAALDSILLHTRRSERLPRRLWPIVAGAGGVRHGGLARARPGHLGGPRGAAALRLVQAHVLGRARPRGEARRDPRRRGAARDMARDRGGDPRRHPRARRRRARRAAPALRDRRARRLDAARGALRVPARTTTRACARASWRSPTS